MYFSVFMFGTYLFNPSLSHLSFPPKQATRLENGLGLLATSRTGLFMNIPPMYHYLEHSNPDTNEFFQSIRSGNIAKIIEFSTQLNQYDKNHLFTSGGYPPLVVAYLAEQPKAINILLDLGFDPEIGAIGDSEFNYSFLKTNAKKDYFC